MNIDFSTLKAICPHRDKEEFCNHPKHNEKFWDTECSKYNCPLKSTDNICHCSDDDKQIDLFDRLNVEKETPL